MPQTIWIGKYREHFSLSSEASSFSENVKKLALKCLLPPNRYWVKNEYSGSVINASFIRLDKEKHFAYASYAIAHEL